MTAPATERPTGLEGVEYALTLICPWAVLVVEGPKNIENRTWQPPPWIIGQRIAIHAGKKTDRDCDAGQILRDGAAAGLWVDDRANWEHRAVRGALIGTALVTGFDTKGGGNPWFFGPYGWTLEDRKPLPKAIPCRGFQKLWRIPDELRGGA